MKYEILMGLVQLLWKDKNFDPVRWSLYAGQVVQQEISATI